MIGSFALVIGESLVDVIDRVGHPGGSPLNVAIGLARLGRQTCLATWFSGDDYGQAITRHLLASGVEVIAGSDGAARTSSAQVVLDAAGVPSYVFDLDWQLPVLPPMIAPLVVHTGSLGAVLSLGKDVLAALRRLRDRGAVVSFDPNIRPAAMGPVEVVGPLIERYVSLAHVVKVSDEDLAFLYPGVSQEAVARRWCEAGSLLVVVTRGAKGAFGRSGEVEVSVAAPPVKVVDTVGAGDSFMAGLLHALWDTGWLDAPSELTEDALRHALTVATATTAVTLTRAGADPPWAKELSL